MCVSAGTCKVIACSAGKLRLQDLPEYVQEGIAKQAHALLPEWVPLSTVLRSLGIDKGKSVLLTQICVQTSRLIERWLWVQSFA
eukprot:6465901-Amphidinium_carterae.1